MPDLAAEAGAIKTANRSSHPYNMPWIAMADGEGDTLGAVVFSVDSFITVLPAEATQMRLSYRTGDTEEEAAAYQQAEAALRELGAEHGEIDLCIWWRCYSGENSRSTDGVSISGRWLQTRGAVVKGAMIVVGKAAVIWRKRKTPHTDPTRHRRLTKAELTYPVTAEACPVLTSSTRVNGKVVVAVHGTMSSAVQLADDLREILGPSIRILRYEHDTWLPVMTNAEELVELLKTIGTRDITLIAHSRGGLIATECAAALPYIRSVTLGTPFFGTPLMDVAEVGLVGLRTMFGALRTIIGPMMVDPGTYMAAFFLRDLPPGLRTMCVDSDLSQQRRLHGTSSITATIAGLAPIGGRVESLKFQALEGLGATDLMDRHDLVVPLESALGRAEDRTEVTCDHFSYTLQKEVREKIMETVNFQPAELDR